jgi:hypothetical protein
VNAGFGPSKEVRNEEWSTNNNAGTGSGGGMGGGFAPMQQWLGTLNNGMGGNGGGGIGGAGNNGQNGGGSGASNFVRLITNTLREVSKGPAENTVSGNGGQMLSGINNLFGGGGGGNSGGQFGNIGQLISAM